MNNGKSTRHTVLGFCLLELLVSFSYAISPALPMVSANSELEVAVHPVSVIEADIYVTKFKTTMRLKCFAEELELLQGVEALDDGFYDTEELREATVDHADYLLERIHLIGADGNRFAGKVVEIIDFELPEGTKVRAGELMQHTIGIILEYKYEQPPEFLTVNQQVVSEGDLLPSELKILLKQEGSEEPYFHMMKPDQPETFRFDWSKPAPDSDATEEEWSTWFEEQRQQTLGITSYSSVYSFIYVTNYEVRHEVLIPLATLNTLIDISRAESSFLEIEEQDVVAEQVEALFSIGNPVEIDNVEVAPVFDRIDFYGLELRDFAVRAERRKVSMANGRVGIIMSYATKGIPRDVKVTWDKFSDTLKTVDSVVIAFDDVSKAEFSMFLDNNTYHWTSDDRKPPTPITAVDVTGVSLTKPTIALPILSIGLALMALPLIAMIPYASKYLVISAIAAALIVGCYVFFDQTIKIDRPFSNAVGVREDDASDIFQQLHRNMFRAFDYHNESEIYDALARSVDGDLLQTLYLEIIDSLKVSEQGGAVSKVEKVDLVDGEQVKSFLSNGGRPAFQYHSKWDLVGSVEHWGHIHQRTNKYDAEFTVELIDGDWKITGMNVKDFHHGPVKTDRRKL